MVRVMGLGSFLLCVLGRKKKMVGAVGMWKTRSVFQGRWAAVGNRAKRPERSDGGFPPLSTARHFHSVRSAAKSGSGAELGDASQQLAPGALHVERGFGIGLMLGEAFEFGQGDTGAEQAPALRHVL